MSLRSLPKTICQSHAPEVLRLRPFGSQWERISRYLATDRKRSYSLLCHVLDAILYVVKTGTQWRTLPGELVRWWAAHYYFRRWQEERRILCILSITSRAARRRAGQHGEPSALITGCQFPIRGWAAECAACSARSRLKDPMERPTRACRPWCPWNGVFRLGSCLAELLLLPLAALPSSSRPQSRTRTVTDGPSIAASGVSASGVIVSRTKCTAVAMPTPSTAPARMSLG